MRDSKAIQQKDLQRLIFENAKRFESTFVQDKRFTAVPSPLREKLQSFARDVFNHQDEFAKGNIALQESYKQKLMQIYFAHFPSKTPDQQAKIKRFVDELLRKVLHLVEQKATLEPLVRNPDPVKREQQEKEAAPGVRRAEAQAKATRRWRTFQEGGFLHIFKQKSEEPSVIPRKRLRRTRTRKHRGKPVSGYFDF